MSETKFTPGPWRVKAAAGGTAIVLATSGTPAIVNSHENARLIAAAPDLYAALEAVVAVADRATVEFDAARAALLKARGA